MLLSLDLELKTNLKGLLQFTCPVLGINHPYVCVCVCGMHTYKHVQLLTHTHTHKQTLTKELYTCLSERTSSGSELF